MLIIFIQVSFCFIRNYYIGNITTFKYEYFNSQFEIEKFQFEIEKFQIETFSNKILVEPNRNKTKTYF